MSGHIGADTDGLRSGAARSDGFAAPLSPGSDITHG